MRIVGNNIVFKQLPNEVADKTDDAPKEFQYTEADKKEMKYHKGEVIDVGPAIDFMKKGDVFYYDQNRAYPTVINGKTVTVTQSPFVVLVLDASD